MNIKCIVVDDEPLSIRILEKYIAEFPQLHLIVSCQNAFEAMEVLQKEAIDLIFLDINMPKLSGISLIKSLSNPPLVIFTTAYPEYAVEGFELEAIDYLLKPFSMERFLKAVNRVSDFLEKKITSENLKSHSDHLLIKAEKRLYKIAYQDIIYLKAYGDYVKIYTKDKMYLTKERLANLEEALPNQYFQRIHRSHIISLNAIQFIEGNHVQIGKEKLSISQNFREALLEKLK